VQKAIKQQKIVRIYRITDKFDKFKNTKLNPVNLVKKFIGKQFAQTCVLFRSRHGFNRARHE
jgi:hypothetical protein